MFNPTVFKGVDATTISNWERKSTPHLSRQVEIIRFFQYKSGLALACVDNQTDTLSNIFFCRKKVEKLLRISKHLILDLPIQIKEENTFKVVRINHTKLLQRIILMHKDLDAGLNNKFHELSEKNLKKFAQYPGNQFYAVIYREEIVLGLLFAFRLRQEAFETFMTNERYENSLTEDDFATFTENASYYIPSFFAMNKKSGAFLLSTFFNHLLKYQSSTNELGTSLLMKERGGILESMNLHVHSVVPWQNGKKRITYRATLKDFIANKNMINILFNGKSCSK